MQYIQTNKAPSAIGPYSQAVVVDNIVYTSGQIALTIDGNMVNPDIKVQTKQVLNNLKEVLLGANSSLDKVLKTTIYLSSMDDFMDINQIYAEFFGSHKPARSTVAVKTLPNNALIEIDAIALI